MTDLKPVLTVVSIVALVSGLSMASISIWAMNAKCHHAEDWYPQAQNVSNEENSATKQAWDKIRISWNEHQEMNLAAIIVGFASGLLQTIVAIFLLYGANQTSPKTLLGRYCMSSMAISIVLLICVTTTIASDLTNPSALPQDLKQSLRLDYESPILENLQYGIRAYDLWVIIDLITILGTIIVATCYMKCTKVDILNQLEIVEVHDPSKFKPT